MQSILERTKFAVMGDEGEPLHKPDEENSAADAVIATEEVVEKTAKTAQNPAKKQENAGNAAKKKHSFEKKGEFRKKFDYDNSKK